MVFLAGTLATLAYALLWAVSTARPVRAHARLTGRRAAPYWYSPTGLQDERGISARPARIPPSAVALTKS